MRATRRMAAATLVLAAVAAPAARSAAPGAGGDVTATPDGAVAAPLRAEEARAALKRAVRLRDGRARGDLTAALMRLVRAYPSLDERGRRRTRDVLARPDRPRDPLGDSYRAPEAAASPACTTNFCVHWVARTRDAPNPRDANGIFDGDGVPDYVELVAGEAERSFATLNGTLGWREPRSDGARGGLSGKTDIYLVDVGPRLFGYAAPDPGQIRPQSGRIQRSLHSYLVVDDDYRRAEFGTSSLRALRVTMAHEYDHVLQFGYDAFQDLWLAESSAVWAEEQVYDGIDDYRRYVRRWVRRTEVPLTGGRIKVYGTAVWNLWLERRYGADLILAAWAGAQRSRPGGFSVAVYDRAIRRAGPSGFHREFARFARDAAEWRTRLAFPEGGSYPDVERVGRLRPGRRGLAARLNHTTFALLAIPAEGRRRIRVTARAPRGITAALALVGRIGSERRGRTVSRLVFRRGGGRMRVALRRPGRFQRLTAVVVNADTTQRGFDPLAFDWRYTGNRARFTVRATR